MPLRAFCRLFLATALIRLDQYLLPHHIIKIFIRNMNFDEHSEN